MIVALYVGLVRGDSETHPVAESAPRRRGRPRGHVTRAKQRELLRMIADGGSWCESARELRLDGDAVLRLFDYPEFRAVVAVLMAERVAAL